MQSLRASRPPPLGSRPGSNLWHVSVQQPCGVARHTMVCRAAREQQDREGWGSRQSGSGGGRGGRPQSGGFRDGRPSREQQGRWERPSGPSGARPGTQRPPKEVSVRMVAVKQLLRIEEEGAYAGLVNGSPMAKAGSKQQQQQGPGQGQRRPSWQEEEGEGDAEGLEEVEEEGAGRRASHQGAGPSGARDGSGSGSGGLSPRQQRTLKQLVAGVTRWRRRLDHSLAGLSGRSADGLEPGVRQVLRLALYELTHLGLAPHALSEFVDLARSVGDNPSVAAGFANGVLRGAARRLEQGGLPDPLAELKPDAGPRDVARCLAIAHSHPTWLSTRWVKRFGREGAEALMAHNNRPPVYTVRLNPFRAVGGVGPLLERLRAAGVDAQPSPLLPTSFVEVRSGLQALLAEGFVARGECVVQDVSAGLVVAALDPRPGETLLDACAAPGGKTLFAAARMQGQGSITACDVSSPRLRALENLARQCGVPPGLVRTRAADLRDLAGPAPATASSTSSSAAPAATTSAQGQRQQQQQQQYDKVLLDAPCSGSGVMAKRADMRWRRGSEDVEQLVALQAELLDAAAQLVKPGGVLVYSTCSIETDEGEEQVAAFLAREAGSGFKLEPLKGVLPDAVLTPSGCLATLPHVHGGVDGAFAARLRRVA